MLCHCPHFIHEETETQRVWITCKSEGARSQIQRLWFRGWEARLATVSGWKTWLPLPGMWVTCGTSKLTFPLTEKPAWTLQKTGGHSLIKRVHLLNESLESYEEGIAMSQVMMIQDDIWDSFLEWTAGVRFLNIYWYLFSILLERRRSSDLWFFLMFPCCSSSSVCVWMMFSQNISQRLDKPGMGECEKQVICRKSHSANSRALDKLYFTLLIISPLRR